MPDQQKTDAPPHVPRFLPPKVTAVSPALGRPAKESLVPTSTVASIEFVPLTDSQGVLLLIPAAVLAHYQSLGLATLHFEVTVGGDPGRSGWLTVTEAAREHLQDVDGITLAQATAKISRACDRQKIVASGHGRDRRIEPTSFSAWRLAQRERELDRAEKEFT